jgi:MoxR-like ATPases
MSHTGASGSVFDEIIKVSLFTPNDNQVLGLPILLLGAPGVAKTARVAQVARRYGLPMRSLILSQCAPEDIGGLPYPNEDRSAATRIPIGPFAALAKEGRGVLFLDEFTCTPPALQGPALNVVHQRVVGDTALGGGVRVILAANPPEQAAGGWAINMAMANRVIFINVEASLDEFSRYLLVGKPTDEGGDVDEAAIEAAFPTQYRQACSIIDAFLKRKPDLLLKVPADNDAAIAFPSYRSWDMAARVIAGCKLLGASDEARRQMIVGTIGEGATHEFLAFLSTVAVLPDPEDVLNDPGKAPLYPRKPDLQIALISSITAACLMPRKIEEQEKRMLQVFAYLERCYDAGMADHAVPAAKEILHANKALVRKASAVKFLGKAMPLLMNSN